MCLRRHKLVLRENAISRGTYPTRYNHTHNTNVKGMYQKLRVNYHYSYLFVLLIRHKTWSKYRNLQYILQYIR